eukprot:114181_1
MTMEPSSPDATIQTTKSKVISNDRAPQTVAVDSGLCETKTNDVVQSELNGSINQEKTAKIESTKQKLSLLLKEWKLARYTGKLIDEMGYDDIEDWKDITEEELRNDMGFKKGHAQRFIRNTKDYFQNK